MNNNANQKPSSVAFDEEAAYSAGYEFSKRNGPASAATKNEITQDFREGAKYQHQQMAAQLGKLRAENEELRNELCDEKYHLNIPEISFGTKAVIRPLPSKAPENQEEIKTLGALRDFKNQLSASADVEFDTNLFIVSHMARAGVEPTYEEVVRAALSAMKLQLEQGEESSLQASIVLKAEIDKLRAELDKWKDEYFNVSKFATDYENKLTAANEIILVLEKGLKDIELMAHPNAVAYTREAFRLNASEALDKLKELKGWE